MLKSLEFAKDLQIPINKKPQAIEAHPHWLINNAKSIIKALLLPKASTPKEKYTNLFAAEKEKYQNLGWKFVYTDGSKTENNTSFAVVSHCGNIIKHGILHSICSVFTAETTAVLEAVIYAKMNKGKFVICTDSQSCINAVESPSNTQNAIVNIRNILLHCPNKIKLMWIPGHVGISGNEHADAAAKNIAITPSLMYDSVSKQDIRAEATRLRLKSLIDDWGMYVHHYSAINPCRKMMVYDPNIPLRALRPFTRLRLGHTIVTHSYLLQRSPIETCPFCEEASSLTHILRCPTITTPRQDILNSADPIELLKNPTYRNVQLIYNFLKEVDLLRRI